MLLEIIFYVHYLSVKSKKFQEEKTKPEFVGEKTLYTFTYPKASDGGVFSKTYIQIDGKMILRLRTLMVPPGELWSKKE